jgi:hypothetical protein
METYIESFVAACGVGVSVLLVVYHATAALRSETRVSLEPLKGMDADVFTTVVMDYHVRQNALLPAKTVTGDKAHVEAIYRTLIVNELLGKKVVKQIRIRARISDTFWAELRRDGILLKYNWTWTDRIGPLHVYGIYRENPAGPFNL